MAFGNDLWQQCLVMVKAGIETNRLNIKAAKKFIEANEIKLEIAALEQDDQKAKEATKRIAELTNQINATQKKLYGQQEQQEICNDFMQNGPTPRMDIQEIEKDINFQINVQEAIKTNIEMTKNMIIKDLEGYLQELEAEKTKSLDVFTSKEEIRIIDRKIEATKLYIEAHKESIKQDEAGHKWAAESIKWLEIEKASIAYSKKGQRAKTN